MMRSRSQLFIPVLLICAGLPGNAQSAQAGASDSAVTIEVFSDFQCPYCGRFAPTLRQLQSKGMDGVKTRVEFKNFPLSFHPFAQLAAQAALAAGEQGKFWEMHDLIFANQAALARPDLLNRARTLHLNMARFERDLDSEAIKKRVAADLAEGAAKKVQGTPTVFVDGKQYSGGRSFEEISALIRADVGRKQALAEITDKMMSKGPMNAPATIDFYADLESPVSRSAHYVLEEVAAKYPATVRVQFHSFHLSFHPRAGVVHDAAVIAARDGHFWEMVNYVFDHQESVGEQELIAYAGELGMDQAGFAEALRAKKYAARIDADLGEGYQRGVRGSPVLFVNGKQIEGVPGVAELTADIDAALAGRLVGQVQIRSEK